MSCGQWLGEFLFLTSLSLQGNLVLIIHSAVLQGCQVCAKENDTVSSHESAQFLYFKKSSFSSLIRRKMKDSVGSSCQGGLQVAPGKFLLQLNYGFQGFLGL